MSDIMANVRTRKTKFSEIWNLPNVLTYGRIVAVPLVAGLLMYGGNSARWIALAIYLVAALGVMLDPIADKVLVAVVLLVLSADGILFGGHIWAAIIILAREVLVSGLREYLGELQVSVPVTQIAKWKTTVQLVAIGFLIVGPAGDLVVPGITRIGIAGLWIAAGLTLYTGYDYFRAGIRHVVDEE